jgi:hypothetical protein
VCLRRRGPRARCGAGRLPRLRRDRTPAGRDDARGDRDGPGDRPGRGAARAAAEDDTWTALHSDIDGAYAHLAASAAAYDAGEIEKSGREIEAYQAADDRVRADCAEADEELGPLQP